MENNYNKIIGYSPLEDVDEEKMLQVIRVNKKIIDSYYLLNPMERILVAGAGQGQEAALLHKEYELVTVGVDLNIENLHVLDMNTKIFFQKQDLAHLAFPDEIFSLIYCYHVLEHVEDPVAVLHEMHRVLTSQGVLFIGFPNRNRLFSYLGTSQKASLVDKLKWNLNDYWYRLKGKFENKLGAHAGFTQKEFLTFASPVFGVVDSVRDQYMRYKYSKHTMMMNLMIKSKLSEFLFPSNYYICRKHAN